MSNASGWDVSPLQGEVLRHQSQTLELKATSAGMKGESWDLYPAGWLCTSISGTFPVLLLGRGTNRKWTLLFIL